MDIQTLTDHFAIPGALAFSQNEHGLLRATITTPACTAELYLQGAHLTQWQPTGQQPVLFLSDRSAFAPGKAIRGGIPLIFPWFGPRTTTSDDPHLQSPQPAGDPQPASPSHGFARTADWTLAFAALSGDDLHLTLTLSPNDATRALGYDHFQLAYQLTLGAELRLQLAVANQSSAPLHFEEAFHTYFSVGDAQQISIIGLSDTHFLDKTDNFKPKHQKDTLLKLTAETDRLYLNTVTTLNLDDPILKRRITVSKANSRTTVIWNPWTELTARLPDMAPDGWRSMTCIETANVAADAITLAPGEQQSMETHIVAQEFVPGYTAQ